MKALVFSDLHLAHSDLDYVLDFPPEAEIAIVAGDVLAPVSMSMRWLKEHVGMRGLPVVFVAGNHEYYGHEISETLSDGLAARTKYRDVHLLEKDSIVLDGVRFLGCTLWTDYDLYQRPDEAMRAARLGLNDHRLIELERDGEWPKFLPQDALTSHQASRVWLEGELATPFDGKTVVVTHHAPHPNSIHPRFLGDQLTPAFVSDLSGVIERWQPDVWVHGHVHNCHQYTVGKTRVVCNPRGYVRKSFFGPERENPHFDPFKIIDI
ncbi:MAG: metallophosphoesterase [Rhizobium sp.]|nr:metallophosphoesterase [Rhizobium sp.]